MIQNWSKRRYSEEHLLRENWGEIQVQMLEMIQMKGSYSLEILDDQPQNYILQSDL